MTGLRWFAAIFLICITAGALIQNWQLRERVVQLEPRVTKVERIVRIPNKGRVIRVTRTVVRRPVVVRRTVFKPVPGPKGERGAKGDKGDRGSRGSQGRKGDQGPQGAVGKTVTVTVTDERLDMVAKIVRGRLDEQDAKINRLFCILLKCPR